MSKNATEFQVRTMGRYSRGLGIWTPLNTGRIDEHVSVLREYIANVFFYTKNGKTIMIDAGYSYSRLREKMEWLGLDPSCIRDILITHEDTDHVGAVEEDSGGLFRNARMYLSEEENRYLTGEKKRKVWWGLYTLPQVHIPNEKTLLKDGQILDLDGIRVECFLVPGHTMGHMVYLIDDRYLFTGDTIWIGKDGGRSFLTTLAVSNRLSVRSLAALKERLTGRAHKPAVLTGHTGWTPDFDFAFAHTDRKCGLTSRGPKNPDAPYDAYDESDDTRENAQSGYLKPWNG